MELHYLTKLVEFASRVCKKVCTFICIAVNMMYFNVHILSFENMKDVCKYKLQIRNIWYNHIESYSLLYFGIEFTATLESNSINTCSKCCTHKARHKFTILIMNQSTISRASVARKIWSIYIKFESPRRMDLINWCALLIP